MRSPHLHLRSTSLRTALALVTLSILLTSPATAQTSPSAPSPGIRWAVGLTGALTHNNHGGPGATGFEGSCLSDAPGGRALGHAAGIAVDATVNERFSINSRLAYELRPGMVINRRTDARSYQQFDPDPTRDDDTLLWTISDDSVMYRNELVCELVTADAQFDALLVKTSPTMSLHGVVGLSVSKILRGTATRARELSATVEEGTLPVNEGDVVENGGRRIVYERDAEVPGLRTLRMSMKGGLAVQADLSSALYMRSGIYYDLGLTDLSAAPRWTLGSTFVQFDFLVRL